MRGARLCLEVQSTDTADRRGSVCALGLCPRSVRSVCTLGLCTRSVHSVCALGLCARSVRSVCALGLCVRSVRWVCALSPNQSPEVIVSGGNGAGSKRVDLEAENYDASIGTRNSSCPIPPSGVEHGAEAVRPGAKLATRHTRTQSRPPSHPTNIRSVLKRIGEPSELLQPPTNNHRQIKAPKSSSAAATGLAANA